MREAVDLVQIGQIAFFLQLSVLRPANASWAPQVLGALRLPGAL